MVSIVIPVYNVASYLDQCVRSVLAQDPAQVILVDDGSTDQSGSLCDRWAQQDARIVVVHKANGGLSSARNAAYSLISGEFTFFLDSDDYLEPGALEALLALQKAHNADVVIGNYWYTYEDHENAAAQPCGDRAMTGREALEELVNGRIQNFAWGKLIRSELAVKHPFPEGKLFEDHFWTHHILAGAETVVTTAVPAVHYRQRPTSISYRYTLSRLDALEGWQARLDFLRENYPELEEAFLTTVANAIVQTQWLVCTKMKADKKAAIHKLRHFEMELQLHRFANPTAKKQIRLFCRSTALYLAAAVTDRLLHR